MAANVQAPVYFIPTAAIRLLMRDPVAWKGYQEGFIRIFIEEINNWARRYPRPTANDGDCNPNTTSPDIMPPVETVIYTTDGKTNPFDEQGDPDDHVLVTFLSCDRVSFGTNVIFHEASHTCKINMWHIDLSPGQQ